MKGTSEDKVVETDVLIIGGGIAGLFAGIKAKDEAPGATVTLVDKACPGASGCSAFAAGVFPYWQPGDDLEAYLESVVTTNSEYLIDQDYAETAIRESHDRFKDLLEYGVDFEEDAEGKIKRFPIVASKESYCSAFAGGPHLMWKVRTRALRDGVQPLERIAITDLLKSDGRCVGAVGFHVVRGDPYVFKAKATVLAAGTLYFNRAPIGSAGVAGDGPALAFRAGVELRNMEQSGSATIGPKGLGSPGLHVIFGGGGHLVNSKGERFMQRYNPTLMELSRRFDMARAILQEWREGRGPCYVDCRHLPPDRIATIRRALPLVMRGLKSQGLDIARDRIEYIPYNPSIMHQAGARLKNANGEVNLEGLWVVGTAGDFCGGADTTAVTALPGSSVQGARAGRMAVQHAAKSGPPTINAAEVDRLREAAFAPLNKRSDGLSVDSVFHRTLEVAFRYINLLKSEDMLNKAMQELGSLKADVKRIVAKDFHELRKAHDVRNMVQLSEVIAKASLLRTESRRAHYRLDHPTRDDRNWLKWVIASLDGDEVRLSTENIPLEKWRYRPKLSG